ncbi:MAG: alpha/beta fold hydrolase [Omnitrophica WOR_2 bacterium]
MNTSWIDVREYPFQPHYLQLGAGRMHYVDEGQGEPVLMVHGTPTWSFLYRHLINGLIPDYRVIAPDHIGFGLSDKPKAWSYLPREHARNLAALIEALSLKDITLVVHDFGGPIGLSYAIEHPENIRRIVIMNTFCWSLRGDPAFERPNQIFNNAFGRFAYTRLNFSPVFMIRAAWGDKRKLTRDIHRHYTQALPTPSDRQGTWVFLQELIGSSDWYESIWNHRENIRNKPALIVWGMKDIAFKEKELKRWEELFPQAQVIRFSEAGHFLQEEEGPQIASLIRSFIKDNR